MTPRQPLVLLILDGWGIAPAGPGNAVSLARTPNLDRLLADHPKARLGCSGRAVGLPAGFMGNSEVGHMNIGAGRIIYQDMTRIDMAVENGSFAANPVLADLFSRTRAGSGRLHLMGLVSDGGVHSHQNHILALIQAAKTAGVPEIFVHVFLDGRDTPPTSGLEYTRHLVQAMQEMGAGTVATITGRYYAMDRDKHYERNVLAYEAMVQGQGIPASDPVQAVAEAYAAGENDEFVKPRVMTGPDGRPLGCIQDGDGVFFFNFRADRARQICRALFDPAFDGFARAKQPRLSAFATMTEYESSFGLPVAFGPVDVSRTLGEVLSSSGLRQLRLAETEKYAHVTYFFNCGREEPFAGEDRIMVPSPREVATYDLKPSMSAEAVTAAFLDKAPGCDLVVVNLANLDMVGHTGIIPAAVSACETVDACLGRMVDDVLARGGRVLLTADHGNAEEMVDASGGPQTAHSKNPVWLVHVAADSASLPLADGVLGDIAPTILDLWGLNRPAEMTGTSLIQRKPSA